MNRLPPRKGSGFIVEIKSGRGRTYHADKKVNGKMVVHIGEKKLLVAAKNIKFIGFID